jgi:acetyl esterase/lipase
MKFLTGAAALALLVLSASASQSMQAAAVSDPAALFAAREAVRQISLSPSGKRIAFIAPGEGQGNALYTADVEGGKPPQLVFSADGKPERLTECNWVSETRLVCTVYLLLDQIQAGQIWPATRVLALDADGSNPKLLSVAGTPDDLAVTLAGGEIVDMLAGEGGSVLMTRNYVPQSKMNTRFIETREGLGVDRVDTSSVQSKSIEPPKMHAFGYISDGRGTIRMMGVNDVAGATGVSSGRATWYYRPNGSHDWKPFSTWTYLPQEGLWPVGVDPELGVAYAFRKIDGRLALERVALDGSLKEETAYAHPQVDVDSAFTLGPWQRIVGATFITDKREAVYFDKDVAALAQTLSKALPGLPLIRFEDTSLDGTKLLLWAGSDTDPGRLYLFDKTTKQLRELMLKRPQLENVPLAAMKPVTYTAADGTRIPAYLTLPRGSSGRNLPAIVMPHGGPSFRDEWGFDWLVQFLASRGYAVLQPNFRGSAGYGDAWYQKNGFQSWRMSIGDVNDAGRWLVSQGIADPSKLAIVGWSYGGYAALQSSVLDADLFRAVVAIAPVTDLATFLQESRYSSDRKIVRDFIGSGPHIREGSPAQNAERIKAPVLLFHGDHDINVRIRESEMMADRLKAAGRSVQLVKYEGLDHQLEDAKAREDMLRRTDAFLRQTLKLP